MTTIRSGRETLPGGYDRYAERSRSRGDLCGEQRGKEYGRCGISDAKSGNTRGDARREEPEGEMHGGKGQYGGGGYGGGGFRDRGNESRGGDGGGYRDRGGQRDRGGERGYGGGGGGGGYAGGSGPKVSTVAEGQSSNMLSNHFRFQTIKNQGQIFIYQVQYGIFDVDKDSRIEAL